MTFYDRGETFQDLVPLTITRALSIFFALALLIKNQNQAFTIALYFYFFRSTAFFYFTQNQPLPFNQKSRKNLKPLQPLLQTL